ncbi:vacuolar protein sorting-associated protein 26A [Tanacetum coccineum]
MKPIPLSTCSVYDGFQYESLKPQSDENPLGSRANTHVETETLAKFELMDGAPVKGESIPIRLFFSPYELTATHRNVKNKFSVEYYLNLVLVDEEDRRCFSSRICGLRFDVVSVKATRSYLNIFSFLSIGLDKAEIVRILAGQLITDAVMTDASSLSIVGLSQPHVVNELIKRRSETEWFIEGDFKAYVSHMKQSHLWGVEPELVILSHAIEKVPLHQAFVLATGSMFCPANVALSYLYLAQKTIKCVVQRDVLADPAARETLEQVMAEAFSKSGVYL